MIHPTPPQVDTDGTLAANSDDRVPSQKAIKTYADALIAANDAMVFKGVIDCSANPNYPTADRGHTYRASVAGKIGGASGVNVEVGDMMLCLTDGTSAGNQAAVGSSWSIIQVNIDGALTTASIGVTVQAYAAELAALAALISAANKVPYFTGAGTAALADFTATGRTLVQSSSIASAQAVLGVNCLHIAGKVLPTAVPSRLWLPATGTGDLDLYTVPSGKRALIHTHQLYNPTGGSITFFPQAKIGGTYYPMAASAAAPAGSITATQGSPIILEAGEIYACNVTATGAIVGANLVLFDNTYPAKGVRLTTYVSGDNVFYTVPAGKTALWFGGTTLTPSGAIQIVNRSGATRDMVMKITPSGSSTISLGSVGSVANNTTSNFSSPVILGAGDVLTINTNSAVAGQFFFGCVLEIDA